MREVERRIENLEQALAPARPVVFYQQDRFGATGLFRRHGDVTGRLLAASEIAADAGPTAIAISIVYTDEPPRIDAPCTVLLLPDNGRTCDNG